MFNSAYLIPFESSANSSTSARGIKRLGSNISTKSTGLLSFDTAMYPYEYKKLQGKPRWANKMNRKREKKCIQSDQPA
jgi:hypothetical protein